MAVAGGPPSPNAPTQPTFADPDAPVVYKPIKLKRLWQTHPELSLQRVKILHALYRGGHHLLGNMEVMRIVFPKYSYEKDSAYADRCARAFYENLFAMSVNQLSAGLAQDPLRIQPNDEDDEDALDQIKDAQQKQLDDTAKTQQDQLDQLSDQDDDEEDDDEDAPPTPPSPPSAPPVMKAIEVEPTGPTYDEYWTCLMEDAGPPTSLVDKRSFDQIMRDWCVEALVTGRGWLQADLPDTNPEENPRNSLAEQEEAGDLRAYLCTWSSEHVTDWEIQNGEFLWVRTYECIVPAPTPDVIRGERVIHRWTFWDKDGWQRYELEVTKDKPMPNGEVEIPPTTRGTHSFKIVPWLMLDFCSHGGKSHLHVGDLLASLCMAHFNRINGEHFQWTQYNYQQLYEFLAPEIGGIDTPVSEAQSDPGRATRGARSPGAVHVRGEQDRAEFVGPDMEGAVAGQQAIQELRDGVLRVVQQMALSQDTSGAMLRRSGDSKQQDQIAQEIMLGAIGKRLLQGARLAMKLLALGRDEDVEEDVPDVQGYEHFDVTDVDDIINQSVLVAQIDVPSATYKIEQLYRLAVAHLGDGTSDKIRQKIRLELQQSIKQDDVMAQQHANMFPPPPPSPFGDDENDETDDEDEEEDEPDDEQTPPPSKPPAKKPPFGGSPVK